MNLSETRLGQAQDDRARDKQVDDASEPRAGSLESRALHAVREMLGALLLDADKLVEVKRIVSLADIVDARYRSIYLAMLALHGRGEPIDFLTVWTETARSGVDVGANFLVDMAHEITTSACVLHHARLVAQHGVRRHGPAILRRYAQMIEDGHESEATELLERASEAARASAAPRDRDENPFPWFAPDLLPEHDPELDVVRGFIAPGEIGCMASPSGVGKTFLALRAAVAVAGAHDEFLGMPVRHGPVLYFCAEGFGDMKKRLQAADPDGKARSRLRLCPRVPMLLDTASVGSAIQSARALIAKDLGGETPLLFVIDTLSRATAGANENDNGQMALAMEMAQEFLRTFPGCAVLLVHHARKGKQPGESSVRGASSIEAAVSAIWGIEVQSDDGPKGKTILLCTEKQKDRPKGPKWKIRLEPAAGSLRIASAELVGDGEIVAGAKHRARGLLRQDAILRVLRGEREGLPVRSIQEELGRDLAASRDTLGRDLDKLRDRGLVDRVGGGYQTRYRLTPKGDRVASQVEQECFSA